MTVTQCAVLFCCFAKEVDVNYRTVCNNWPINVVRYAIQGENRWLKSRILSNSYSDLQFDVLEEGTQYEVRTKLFN